MSEYKGIPGPWECRDNFTVISSEGQWVADVGARPTANLIAAAPELLDSCLRMRNQLQAAGYEAEKGSLNPTKCLLAQVEEAIAKALGQ